MRKLISFSLVAVMLLSCFYVCAFAAEKDVVKVRIEGVEKNLLDSEYECELDDSTSVADILSAVDAAEENIEIKGIEKGYVEEINGVKAGKFGGYDGWYFAVNDTPSETGIADAKVKSGDSIVMYYGGFPCQYPVVDYSNANEGVLTFQSYDAQYDANWNATYSWVPVTDAKVYLDGKGDYTTDANGKITFNPADYGDKISVQIEKNDKSGAPAICRLAPSFTVALTKETTVTEPTTTEPETAVTEPVTTVTEPVTTEPIATKPVAPKTKITLTVAKTVYVTGKIGIKLGINNPVGQPVFKISNSKIASFNSKTGLITAKKAGKVTFTVSNNGVSKSVKITVKNPKLNKTKASLKPKKSFKLRVTGLIGKATFTLSKKGIVKINSNGTVKAIKKGKTTVKVKANGIVLKCNVTVK